ncbi:MAG: histidine triad nucleotide-binding protein [Oscillospiraceae bacterium]|nr:histidine triad nucleotide-binding protein [Oscillospiraceae bacterium]
MDCIFCKIAQGLVPSQKLYEDSSIVAFNDINPAAPVHILVVPREHIPSAAAIREGHYALMGHIWTKIPVLAKKHGLEQFRVVTNAGQHAGQTVEHLHFHILGGHKLNAALG